MIAKIYPAGHPDSEGKTARYFDIRKLTEGECLRLMDVPERHIRTLVESPELSKSAIYKLAGNSIVVSCLYHIFRQIYSPQRDANALPSLFPEDQWRVRVPYPIRMVTLCSGYDSQLMAMDKLAGELMISDGTHPLVDLVAWSEFDPESKKPIQNQPAVVAHNLLFPEFKDRNLGDMTKIDWEREVATRPEAYKDLDVLTYSTPCQSVSQAGKRTGIKRGSGTRSAVLWYTEEAIRVLRPKFLLQENVKALCNKVNMPDFQEWQDVCAKLGYDNYWTVLNAKDFGVPQNRERVFMLSVRRDLNLPPYEFPKPFPLTSAVADVLQEDAAESYFLRPEGVIRFLQAQEGDNDGCLYEITDHFLSNEEIAQIRMRNTRATTL